jgi:hypothetical protein
MKHENVYKLLILFVIFLFFKKVISIVIEAKFPTYNDLDKASDSWKKLVKVRSFTEIISIIATLYLLINYTFNFFIRTIFLIILFNSILYFFIDRRLIYLFVNNTEKTHQYVYFLDTYGDNVENMTIAIFSIYALITIFNFSK